jgi:hypothetical protein
MGVTRILNFAIICLVLLLMGGCYTQLGTVKSDESESEDVALEQDSVYAEEEYSFDYPSPNHYVTFTYYSPGFHPGFGYYDTWCYDSWYWCYDPGPILCGPFYPYYGWSPYHHYYPPSYGYYPGYYDPSPSYAARPNMTRDIGRTRNNEGSGSEGTRGGGGRKPGFTGGLADQVSESQPSISRPTPSRSKSKSAAVNDGAKKKSVGKSSRASRKTEGSPAGRTQSLPQPGGGPGVSRTGGHSSPGSTHSSAPSSRSGVSGGSSRGGGSRGGPR